MDIRAVPVEPAHDRGRTVSLLFLVPHDGSLARPPAVPRRPREPHRSREPVVVCRFWTGHRGHHHGDRSIRFQSARGPICTGALVVTSIEVADVTKTFSLRHDRSLKQFVVGALKGKFEQGETFNAVNGVSFNVEQGETLALLGFNGSGKSTMLKLISGVLRPDSGTIGTRGRVAGLIEVGAGFHPDLTGRENVYLNGAILGMDEATIENSFDDIVAFSEIERFIDTEVKHYSSGMFLRLAFAVAVHTDPEVFLIDEILAVGDEPFQKKCLARIHELSEDGRTLVIVSHDLDMISRVCDRGILLEHGKVKADGDCTEVVKAMRNE
ncbi:ABC transporter ATP-binding protein [Micrococcales bacterium 31B]|nr:ABC transporter ATP-binding protein [Micrococcales bacterium 31B]